MVLSCARMADPSQGQRIADSPLHRIGYVRVRDGTRLHYLDWGGHGTNLVLLAGLGASAHTFDDLAPQLTDCFRVIAITRRGTGESARPNSGYDVPSRTRDDIDVLDSLGIKSALFVGHSVAGDELTELATHYPDRVIGLVYLDAAYDRATTPPLRPDDPVFHRAPRASRGKTFTEMLDVQRRLPLGLTPAMVADLSKTMRGPRDEIIASPPDSIAHEMITETRNWHPDYRPIKAPAIAIYAFSPARPTNVTNIWGLDSTELEKSNADWRTEHWAWQRQEIERFRQQDPQVRIIELNPADHLVYFSNPSDVLAAIRAFCR